MNAESKTVNYDEPMSIFESSKSMYIALGESEEMATSGAIKVTKKYFPNFEEILKEVSGMAIPDPEESQKVEKPSEMKKEKTIIQAEVKTKPEDQKTDMAQGRQAVLNICGAVIDPNKINQGIAEEVDPSNPARVLIQQNQQPPIPNIAGGQQPVFNQQAQMIPADMGVFTPGATQQQMGKMCSCGDPNCPGGHGDIVIPMGDKIRVLHRIDEKPKEKPPVAKPDNVDVELKDVDMTKGMVASKPKTTKPEFIEPLPQGEPINPALEKNAVDNSPLIAKVDKVPLDAIQKIANDNGHSVAFYEYPNEGIISVITYGINGNAVYPKSFCIDLGHVIDARVKLITNCPILPNNDPYAQMIEFGKFYELFVIDPKSHKKVLDTQLLNDMFSAGYMNIKKRPMYTDEYLALNRKLALISIPTKGLNKEQRNAVQTFLIDSLDKTGYLDLAISKTPNGCRFVFLDKELNKKNLANFTLINEGVPKFYGTQAQPVVPTVIKVTNGVVTVKANGEDVPLTK